MGTNQNTSLRFAFGALTAVLGTGFILALLASFVHSRPMFQQFAPGHYDVFSVCRGYDAQAQTAIPVYYVMAGQMEQDNVLRNEDGSPVYLRPEHYGALMVDSAHFAVLLPEVSNGNTKAYAGNLVAYSDGAVVYRTNNRTIPRCGLAGEITEEEFQAWQAKNK